ncbi:MAG: glycosyltransferase [Nocardioidaceae bacterium]
MSEPRVLHVVRDWVRPSETFVTDVVAHCRATVPVVAYGRPGPVPTPACRRHHLGRLAARGDRPLRVGLAAVATARRCRLVHAHFGYWAGHAEALARRTGRPWTVALHGRDVLVEGAGGVAARADRVIVPSAFLADAASRAGVPDEALRVVPSGLDLARHPYRPRTPHGGPVTVTFAGRYVEKKGVLDAARAMAGVPGLRCRFVGAGPQEQQLRSLLRELGLEAELLDGDEPGAVHAALDATDLLVTPSRVAEDGDAESLGIVNLEALARGVPVVTTLSGGIPETVPATAAVLVPERDLAALTRALAGLAAAPDRWAGMGAAGRAHVEAGYRLRDRVDELEQLWLELLSDRGAR